MHTIDMLKQNPLYILWIWFFLINLVSFIFMGIDKQKAIKGKWRIPEKRLFLIALIGGSIGGILGMYVFRHKTRHRKFNFGFPAIFFVQLIAIILIYMNLK